MGTQHARGWTAVDIMDMCRFYRTATKYLTGHLPFLNELFYDLAVLPPLMLKEDQACQVIR